MGAVYETRNDGSSWEAGDRCRRPGSPRSKDGSYVSVVASAFYMGTG